MTLHNRWRVVIREATYREQAGYSISATEWTATGKRVQGWPQRIFVPTRAQADTIKVVFKNTALTREQRNERIDYVVRGGE